MTFKLLLATAAAAVALPLLAVSSASADTSPTGLCTFQPVLPARISIGQAVQGVQVGLRYNDPNCASTQFNVSNYLVNGTDSNFEYWSTSSPTDTLTLFAGAIAPGRYTTTAGSASADAPDFSYTIPSQFINASTVVKYTGRVVFSVSRHLKQVALQSVTYRFAAYQGYVRSGSTIVDLQRLIPATRTHAAYWQTFRRARSTTAGVYRFTYTNAHAMRYRVMVEETPIAFAATSGQLAK